MCTLTYLPLGDDNFLLTSNRDETPLRKTIAPQEYLENEVKLMYPKDKIAGGTWIGKSEKNRVVCLLNGGFENHVRKLPYRMSRGVVVINILTADDAIHHVENFDFRNIEPFTLVLIDWNTGLRLYELVWTGTEKHFKELPQKPRIWSSSSLYNQEMKLMRKEWFQTWLNNQEKFTKESILNFHKRTDLGTKDTTLKMKRPFVETVSITSIEKREDVTMEYLDFLND